MSYKDGNGSWINRAGFTAIEQFNFSDGTQYGNGYMEVSSTAAGGGTGHEVSGADKVGEVFTVSSPTMNVGSLNVAVARMSGSAPLVATLVSNGQVVASAAEAGVVPQGSSSWEPYNQQWAKFSLNATLQQGQTYQLELSAPAGTVYTVNGVRDGNAAGYGFSPNTVFSDGYANYNTGSGWTQGWDTWGGSPVKDQDLSFYFSSSVVTPPAPVTTGSGSDTLVLSISEDAYANGDGTSDANGDAAFTVSVDGKQLAGTFFATAPHSAGASQNFTFKGDWAPGAHAVTVNFLNDAWGGTREHGSQPLRERRHLQRDGYEAERHARHTRERRASASRTARRYRLR